MSGTALLLRPDGAVRARAASLADLCARWDAAGVGVDAYLKGDGHVWLDMVERGDAPAGHGRLALADLCALADAERVSIGLVVIYWNTPLVELYGSLGFAESADAGIRDEEDDYALMVRRPR